MRGKKLRLCLALAAALTAVALTAGCGQYQAGEPFQEPREDYLDQSTPVAAVQKLLMSMEWIDRDPKSGRDFDAFVEVAAPALFPDSVLADPQEMDKLRKKWNSRDWEVEFKDLRFETEPPEADDPGWEGDEATVRIVDGLVRYTGKEMFDTTEWKVESFKDKPGEFVLQRVDGRWRVMRGQVAGDGDYWEVR